MKPAPFDYFAPATVEEAVALLEQNGEEAKVLAGGQSLVPLLNFRLVRPKALIDINGIPGLSYLKEDNGRLRIGALTRHRAVEHSPLVQQKHGLLFEAVKLIGHPAIRTRGTVGGSIAHADPTAELPTLLTLLEGEVQAAGPQGRRTIKWQDFFVSYFATALEPGEICTEVVLPFPSPTAGWAFEEFCRRHGDFGLVGVAALIESDGKNRCTEARLAIAGVGPMPVRATAAEQFLKGQELTADAFEQAGQRVAEQIEPDSDLHASAEYRRHLAAVITARALARARERLKPRGGK